MFSTNGCRPEGGAVHLFMEEKDMIIRIITALVLLVVGFILLVKGADFFVEGSASVAEKIKDSITCNWYDNCGNGNQFA